MTLRVLLGTLLGGIAIFLGGAMTHVVLPISDNGLKPLPNELAMIDTLKKALPAPGVYIYPGAEGVNQNDQAAMKAYEDRVRDLPHGIIVLGPALGGLVTPKKLVIQFIGDVLAALAASLLLVLAPAPTYLRRLLAVTLLGLYAGFLINIPGWNWYGFSDTYLRSDILDHVLRSLCGGLVIAAIVRK